MKKEEKKIDIPLATYDMLIGIFDRIADVTGTVPKKRLFGRRIYTITDDNRVQVIKLSRKKIKTIIWKAEERVSEGTVRFPISGKAFASCSKSGAILNIKSFSVITLVFPVRYVTEEILAYIIDGTVPKSVSERESVEESDSSKKEEYRTPGSPYSFTIIRDASVPPMSVFPDPREQIVRHTKPAESAIGKKSVIPANTGRTNPFFRRNATIIERAKGKSVEVYTDGGLRKEQKRLGAWAFTVLHSQDVAAMEAGVVINTDIARMELLAAVKAIHALVEIQPEDAVIYTDSRYVRNGAEMWWRGWLDRDGSFKTEIANQDLWKDLIETREKLKGMLCDVTFVWIKGHSNNKWNDYVDAKNKEAMNVFTGKR